MRPSAAIAAANACGWAVSSRNAGTRLFVARRPMDLRRRSAGRPRACAWPRGALRRRRVGLAPALRARSGCVFRRREARRAPAASACDDGQLLARPGARKQIVLDCTTAMSSPVFCGLAPADQAIEATGGDGARGTRKRKFSWRITVPGQPHGAARIRLALVPMYSTCGIEANLAAEAATRSRRRGRVCVWRITFSWAAGSPRVSRSAKFGCAAQVRCSHVNARHWRAGNGCRSIERCHGLDPALRRRAHRAGAVDRRRSRCAGRLRRWPTSRRGAYELHAVGVARVNRGRRRARSDGHGLSAWFDHWQMSTVCAPQSRSLARRSNSYSRASVVRRRRAWLNGRHGARGRATDPNR